MTERDEDLDVRSASGPILEKKSDLEETPKPVCSTAFRRNKRWPDAAIIARDFASSRKESSEFRLKAVLHTRFCAALKIRPRCRTDTQPLTSLRRALALLTSHLSRLTSESHIHRQTLQILHPRHPGGPKLVDHHRGGG